MGTRGGARKGAGRKKKIKIWQRLWLKNRYREMMLERAIERASLLSLSTDESPDDPEDAGIDELRRYQEQLRERRQAISLLEENMREAEAGKKEAEANGNKSEVKKWARILEKIPNKISQHWEDAEVIRGIAAGLIGIKDGMSDEERWRVRLVASPGAGSGPLIKGAEETTAEETRELVAAEANTQWGRKDITARIVRRCCEMKLTDVGIFKAFLDEQEEEF